jgi:hypothetical protein
MENSFRFQSEGGDDILVDLLPLDSECSNDLHLTDSDVEIYQIVLCRESGNNVIGLDVLMKITDSIAKVFLRNPNLILYYVCDDMNEIPNGNHDIPPQEYRSRLFSCMFARYIKLNGINVISDTPIEFPDAVGNNQYVHVISHNKYLSSVEEIVRFVIEGYAVGK